MRNEISLLTDFQKKRTSQFDCTLFSFFYKILKLSLCILSAYVWKMLDNKSISNTKSQEDTYEVLGPVSPVVVNGNQQL